MESALPAGLYRNVLLHAAGLYRNVLLHDRTEARRILLFAWSAVGG